VRRFLPGAVLVGLLTIISALPALAAAAPAYMPPNDAALVKALIGRGEIPRAASRERRLAMLQAYLTEKLGSRPEDRVTTGRALGDIALRGRSRDTMQSYYLEMPKGAYRVTGQIEDRVQVPYPEAWYGRDDADGHGNPTRPSWRVAADAVKALKITAMDARGLTLKVHGADEVDEQ